MPGTEITLDILLRKDASSTNAILDHFANNDTFLKWSAYQSETILLRDAEDGEKLQQGIDIAIERGTLEKLTPDKLQPYLDVDVLGKTPEEVSSFIWNQVLDKKKELSDSQDGELIVLCGLSGTGKGTTFGNLGSKLRQEKDPNKVVNWSNGNIFRSVTLLAVLWCEQQGPDVHVSSSLTKENISNFMKMLSFSKIDGEYDTKIEGMGLSTTVSKIENTLLKQMRVSKNIPTVAEQIQGEVIQFANNAMSTLREAGMTILLEGREQTLNYMETPYKFRLMLSDESLIGKRRAAQRLMAQTLERIQDNAGSDVDLESLLDLVLQSMANEELKG